MINKNLDANTYSKMANAIRVLTIDAVEAANSGHPGMPMGMADVATLLFSEFLKFDPKNPKWVDRDRFVLSAGHGSMLIYALLYLTGYSDISLDEIKNFRQFGSKTVYFSSQRSIKKFSVSPPNWCGRKKRDENFL